jgi:uncharacterized protein (DUF1330 family)
MSAYVVAEADRRGEVRYEDYRVLAIPAVEKYGGRFLNGRSDCPPRGPQGDTRCRNGW